MSHIAAVLPLRRVRGTSLPLAALAIGSMSPDAVYFVPGLRPAGVLTHQWWATVTIDVAIALVGWMLWRSISSQLHDFSPTWLRARWRPAGWNDHAAWTVVVGAAVGAVTHVIWDSFTHAGRWGSTHLGFLAASYPTPFGGSWPGYHWAQYVSGMLGLAVIAGVGWRQPTRPVEPRPAPTRLVALVIATGLAGAAIRILATSAVDAGSAAIAFAAATGGLAASAAAIVLVCWLRAARVRAASTATRRATTDLGQC